MHTVTKEEYQDCRRELLGKLEPWLKAEGLLLSPGRMRCVQCGEETPFSGIVWQCPRCGAMGELLETAAILYPGIDDYQLLRTVYRKLGMKFSLLDTVGAEDLMEMEFPLRPFLVEDLLGQGVYLLAGAAKIGKSWLALDLAQHVSTGEDFWGRRVTRGEVLYLSLEDTYERLQSRLSLVTDGSPGPIALCIECSRAGEGLEEQLARQIAARPGLRLIIVDTLQKVRRSTTENYSYSADYDVISTFKRLADAHGITVVIVHHTRKEDAGDAFNMVSGTMGLNGAADGTLVLYKPVRCGDEALLQVTGRDLPDQRLRLQMERTHMRWLCLGSAEDTEDGPAVDPILLSCARLVREEGSFEGTASELLERLAPDSGTNAAALGRKLNANAAQLARLGVRMETRRSTGGRSIRLEAMT